MNIVSIQNKNQNFVRIEGWAENRALRYTVIFSALLLIANLFGLLVDDRTLVGESIWIKPTKFAISSIFYSGTLLWLLTYIKDRPRFVAFISWTTAIAMFVELVLISVQAWRGVRSHFNVATPLDTAIFSTMGTMITLLWAVSLVALILLMRQSFAERAWGIALKWALFVTVIGSALGFTMTSPNASQLEAAELAGVLLESGAHSVGVPDGGEGLPFVGWSTEGGDLRIGHFIGLHALQVIPLLGLAIIQLNQLRSERAKINLIHLAGAGYLGIIMIVTWQAFRGEPLIYPGPLTLAVAGAFLLLFGLAVSLVMIQNTR